jgi:hypothetical protein
VKEGIGKKGENPAKVDDVVRLDDVGALIQRGRH